MNKRKRETHEDFYVFLFGNFYESDKDKATQ